MKRFVALLALPFMAACSAAAQQPEPDGYVDAMAALEERTGGTLGMILMDETGRSLLEYNAGQRMAFCSSFKFQLAATVYREARRGAFDLDEPISFDADALPGYSPVLEADEDGQVTLREAIAAAVRESDNGATNILIDALGGTIRTNFRWRDAGDFVSQLNRDEPGLNENLEGDDRDSSTPHTLANNIRLLALSSRWLHPVDRAELFRLSVESRTGLDRVRKGLPEAWVAGDKTGTCKPPGMADQQVNDIGWFMVGPRLYTFAVMVQRPTADLATVKAAMADSGRLMAQAVEDLR